MNNKSKDIELNWMSKNRPLTQDNVEPDQNISPSVAGIEPKTVKMVRPFAEAEARERERVRAKQEARAKAEQEAKIKAEEEAKTKAEAELQPKTVKMVAPFAEAEAREREEREKAKVRAEQAAKIKAEQKKVTATGAIKTNSNASPPATPEKPSIIPDQLNITIRTSIPGYQKIEYKPSMTIKDSDSKGVQFNPLIRLNKSTIDKIPKEYRVKQFFNKGLFQSMLTYNGGTPAKNLTYATRAGYVDNNIKVTLDSIFPVNSVIYVGKNPYAIGDVQWSSGDWKIEVKQKKVEIDPDKVTDPLLYTQLVRDEIISGEEQLNQLPTSLIVGNNYSGPPVAHGIKKTTTEPPIQPPVPPSQPPVPPRRPPVPPSQPPVPPTTTSKEIVKNPSMQPIRRQYSDDGILEPVPMIKAPDYYFNEDDINGKNALPKIANEPYFSPVEEVSPQEEAMYQSLKGSHAINNNSTEDFIAYFLRDSFWSVANSIFMNSPAYVQEQIRKFYILTTQQKVDRKSLGLSPTLYKSLCNQVKIYKTVSNGNCFFDAVAFGINIYNHNNQNDKIVFGNYGIKQLFTIASLRDIVLRYYEDLDERQKADLVIIGDANVNNLNNLFAKSIKQNPPTTNEEYMDRINAIYKSDENFFVYKPAGKPIDINEDFSPFKRVTEGQVANYIRSNDYWGDQFAIQAICNKLKLYIIPIEAIKKKTFINRKLTLITDMLARLPEPDKIKDICSNRVLFLYKKNLHYELIKIYYNKTIVQKQELVNKLEVKQESYPIFKSNNLPPPFHILILIYGSNYVRVENAIRNSYGIYSGTMKIINDAVIKILKQDNLKQTPFVKKFNSAFALNVSLTTLIARQNANIVTNSNIGEEKEEEEEEEEMVPRTRLEIEQPPNLENEPPPYVEDVNPIEIPKNIDLSTILTRARSERLKRENQQSRTDNPTNITGGAPPYNYPPYNYPPYNYPPYNYPPYGYPPYRYPQYDNKAITKKPEQQDTSKIAYAITIDMELHPGTSLTPEQINQSKCTSKYNAIRKAFSEFTGRPYVIPPVYKTAQTKKNVGGRQNRITRRRH